MVRERFLVPPPQVRSHLPQKPHFVVRQLELHFLVPHDRTSTFSGQPLPPYLDGVITFRFLFCNPPPHALVHLSHGVHFDITQSWPQGCVAHLLSSFKAPQAFGSVPFGNDRITRFLVWFPTPHSLLQGTKWPHEDIRHFFFRAHWCVLQVFVSLESGHPMPPAAGFVVIDRFLNMVPPSQRLVHRDHLFHSLILQFVGHF